jgi:hypothetical protein
MTEQIAKASPRFSEHMTPEERERFRQRIRERFGFGPSTSESKE